MVVERIDFALPPNQRRAARNRGRHFSKDFFAWPSKTLCQRRAVRNEGKTLRHVPPPAQCPPRPTAVPLASGWRTNRSCAAPGSASTAIRRSSETRLPEKLDRRASAKLGQVELHELRKPRQVGHHEDRLALIASQVGQAPWDSRARGTATFPGQRPGSAAAWRSAASSTKTGNTDSCARSRR